MILLTEYSMQIFKALAKAGYKNTWETNHEDPNIIFGSNAFSYGTSTKHNWQYIKPEDVYGFLLMPTRESKIEYLLNIGIKLTEGERRTL